MDPEVLLFQAGYTRLLNGSFVRQFDDTHRFHAYIVDERKIEIHTDLSKSYINKRTKHGYTYHIASTYYCKEERKRIIKFIPPPEPKLSKKGGFNDEILPRERMLEALKDL